MKIEGLIVIYNAQNNQSDRHNRHRNQIAFSPEPIGWYVGYGEQGQDVYFFAAKIDLADERDLAARIEVTRFCLQEPKLL